MVGPAERAHTTPHPHRTRLLTRKRVLLVALPTLMEDLVRRACEVDDTIELGPSLASLEEMRLELRRREVDVVIAGVTHGDGAEMPLAVLELRPRARVLLVAVRDAVAELFELRPQRTRLGAVTPGDIRRAVGDDGVHATTWANLGPRRAASGG